MMSTPHQDNHPLLAREGWGHIVLSLAAALLIGKFAGLAWSIPFWIFAVFVVQFFRDPKRDIPTDANAVVSPADGKIVALETTKDPYLNRQALKISVFMNVFSVHSNRAPVSATVDKVDYFAGSFVNAALDKASAQNERNAVILDHGGAKIVSVQIAGLIARRILCYVKQNDSVERGQRYGFIRFGSRVDVYLPEQTEARVKLGQQVSAGSDIIAVLNPAD